MYFWGSIFYIGPILHLVRLLRHSFRFFMLLDAFSISSVVKGIFNFGGFYDYRFMSCVVTAVNMFLKCSVIMLACSFFRPGIHHIFTVYNEGFIWFVAV